MKNLVLSAAAMLALTGCGDELDPNNTWFHQTDFCRHHSYEKFPQDFRSRLVQERRQIRVPWGPEVCSINSWGIPMCHQPEQVAGYEMVTVRRDIDVNADARQNFNSACLRVPNSPREQFETFLAQY